MKLRLRKRIRAMTDKLAAGKWLRMAAFVVGIPHAPRGHLSVTLRAMLDAEQLTRRGAPKFYEYRSGLKPVIDRRTLRKGKPLEHGHRFGFAYLARLEREDPEKWARLTEGGTR